MEIPRIHLDVKMRWKVDLTYRFDQGVVWCRTHLPSAWSLPRKRYCAAKRRRWSRSRFETSFLFAFSLVVFGSISQMVMMRFQREEKPLRDEERGRFREKAASKIIQLVSYWETKLRRHPKEKQIEKKVEDFSFAEKSSLGVRHLIDIFIDEQRRALFYSERQTRRLVLGSRSVKVPKTSKMNFHFIGF